MVTSAPSHVNDRNFLRQTWTRHWVFGTVRFFLGNTEDEKIRQNVLEESVRNNDMCFVDMLDSYRGLSYKVMAVLNWTVSCKTTKFVMKVDDDVIINPDLFSALFKDVHSKYEGTNTMFGTVYRNSGVLRTGKWAVTREEWESDTYPDYVNGPCYALTVEAVKGVLRVRPEKEMWLEDLYVTGRTLKTCPTYGFLWKNVSGWP